MKVVLKTSEEKKANVVGWLRPRTEYWVLEISSGTSGEACYRIESEDNRTPVMFEAKLEMDPISWTVL